MDGWGKLGGIYGSISEIDLMQYELYKNHNYFWKRTSDLAWCIDPLPELVGMVLEALFESGGDGNFANPNNI